jgi:hypothetical protein
MFIGLLRAGRSPEEAESQMRSLMPSTEIVTAAVQRFRDVANKVIIAREPYTMRDPEHLTPWYTKPRPADEFWPALRNELKSSLDDAAIKSVDRASTKIVANLPPPWQRDFSGRGLVLGYVQSGKTANYISVIAKAADAGYRLVIILSGIHNNLRKQTQRRMDSQLVELNKRRWFQLTDEAGDFGNPGNADALLAQDSLRLLAVVKKNKWRLENLNSWLASASAGAKSHCPILVIDDEADQASVNTSEEYRTTINRLILDLLSQQKVAYVGYTATPFANIFVDPTVPEDLYPRDFVVDLPRPEGYFGPERLFGREPLTEDEAENGVDGLDMILTVPGGDARLLRPPRKKVDRAGWAPAVPSSLREAISWFVLATAARRARGHVGKHSSMLIHTTQLAELHIKFKEPVQSEVRKLAAPSEIAKLEALWNRETQRVPPGIVGETPVEFQAVAEQVPGAVSDVKVVIDNYLSEERLDYESGPQTVIVIGGNTLSRGLTLEGLVVSYFIRSANAYDTLLQMGRWFGYRRGYADLPRIWLTSELNEYFRFLATVEAEIRVDVERYELEDLTPSEFAVRVQTHPQLAITSALKMRAAEDIRVSYSGRRLQTILFEHQDADWLASNWAAGQKLVETIGGSAAVAHDDSKGRKVWTSVPVSTVIDFLRNYRFHPNSQELVAKPILDYVRQQNEEGELLHWNVGLVTREPIPTGKRASLTTDGQFAVGLINRSAVRTGGKSYANIKSLMSREDRVMDLPGLTDEQRSGDDAQLQQLRPQKVGLLILYPIDKASTPRTSKEGTSNVRTDLNAVSDVLGVGLVFPDAGKRESRVSYKAVALPLGDVDEIDEPDPVAVDTEGSFSGGAEL